MHFLFSADDCTDRRVMVDTSQLADHVSRYAHSTVEQDNTAVISIYKIYHLMY